MARRPARSAAVHGADAIGERVQGRRLRLALLGLVAIVLAPGTWLRSTPPPPDDSQQVTIRRLEVPRIRLNGAEGAERVADAPILDAAWQLTSPNSQFGSYSALLLLPGGRFLAASDRGALLKFGLGDAAEGDGPLLRRIFADDGGSKNLSDLEALTRDPATGRIWAAYESRNAIVALDADMRLIRSSRPAAMADWPSNGGPESLVRLADGRFIAMAEASRAWFANSVPALLFGVDPVNGTEPVRFRFAAPNGFRPVDMAQLPDGQVLILTRRFVPGLPPEFETKLVLADPGTIRPGMIWRGRTIATIAEGLPTDNYEGLAIEEREDGIVVIWLISDDNGGQFQRTLLLRLLWQVPERSSSTGLSTKGA